MVYYYGDKHNRYCFKTKEGSNRMWDACGLFGQLGQLRVTGKLISSKLSKTADGFVIIKSFNTAG